MKKYLYKSIIALSLLLFVGVSSTSAQIKFGLKAGFDVAENKINKDILNAHNRLGFQVGPTLQIGIPLIGLGVETGLLYGFKKYDVKEDEIGDLSNYNYLMVPLQLKKSFSLLGTVGVYAKGGPYAEFKLGGGDIKFNHESLDKIKSKNFGAGLNFGVGVNLFSKLEAGIDYRFKLTENYSDYDPGFGDIFKTKKDKTWNVNLTYLF